ncbi:chondroitin sulfate synthase 3-like isoform X2 [Dysidea avara]|uniref:chondroitin sulfate synthase 3-like isoform X2 n=1 Tax=Dysidea avara TaxID=196820 RepID=UPI00333037EB
MAYQTKLLKSKLRQKEHLQSFKAMSSIPISGRADDGCNFIHADIEGDQTFKSEKLLSEDILRLERKSPHLLFDEVNMKQQINYVIIRDPMEGANEQLWELDVAELNIFVPTGKPETDGKVEMVSKSTTVTHFHSDVVQLSPLVVLWRVCNKSLKQFHWIFFGPSSVYINTHGLESYLTQLDSSKPVWLSGLAPDNKTCVWNSGIVFSYYALKLVCPAISNCISNAVANPTQGNCLVGCVEEAIGYTCATRHPDNIRELFLDVTNKTFASSSNFSIPINITYDSDSEVQRNTTGDTATIINHEMLEKALVIYPATNAKFKAYFHHYFVLNRLSHAQEELVHHMNVIDFLQDQLPGGDSAIHSQSKLLHHDPLTSVDEILTWELITHDTIHSDNRDEAVVPVTGSYKDGIDAAISKAVDYLNKENSDEYQYRKLVAAYRRVDPLVGTEYILEFEAATPNGIKTHRVILIGVLSSPDVSPLVPFDYKTVVNIVVVTDCDNNAKFENFIKNFEDILLEDTKVSLTVLEMKGTAKTSAQKKNQLRTFYVVSLLQTKYPNIHIEAKSLDSPLSRDRAISIIAKNLAPSDLVFLADIDVRFNADFLHRCRNLVSVGQQVYFPILFRRYNPELLSLMNHSELADKISEHSGYWLSQSHGLACIYVADIINSFSQTGAQDVPPLISSELLLSKLFKKGVHVVRSPDKDVWRPYDTRHCEENLHGENQACDATEETAENHYVHYQLASLLFNHEHEHAMQKF